MQHTLTNLVTRKIRRLPIRKLFFIDTTWLEITCIWMEYSMGAENEIKRRNQEHN